jgi:5'-AMP-activated protein kinase catalytic alpha subunit
VDVWSCGIILFAMLCGYLPFEDENTNKLYKKILAGDFHLPKHLSDDAKALLKQILNVNPETRFNIAKIR